jgi:hypothetical protein
VILHELGELRRAGLLGRQAGDRVDSLLLDLAGPAVGAAALDLHGLDSLREEQAGLDGADLQAADPAAAVPGPGGAGLQRDLPPGPAPQLLSQLLLVSLDDQEVVAAGGDDVLGAGPLGVHRIGGADDAAQVEPVQQRAKAGISLPFAAT